MVRRMRVRTAVSFVLPACVLAAACGDDLPTYPPVVIVNVGANVGGNTSTGNNSNNNNGNNGNRPTIQGGDNSGGDGSSTGGSAPNMPGLYPHCDAFNGGDDPPVGKVECDMDSLADGGPLGGDITGEKTLESGKFYTLTGVTRITEGSKLIIPPCVKIIGKDSGAVLAALPGNLGDPFDGCTYDKSKKPKAPGQLIAVGEPMAPIVFTSAKEVGKRRPGDWGGVLLMGNARNNKAAEGTRVQVEGLANIECHGWHTNDFNDESSGDLEYVRIEYASRQLSMDSETNGLTLASCGSGTKLSHVMVSNSADDCFEWFGGTMNADHLIALNCEDDMFDADDGFSGNVQFMFGRQWPTTTESDSSGFEIDTGIRMGSVLSPATTANFSNFTVCGAGPTDTDVRRVGLALRAGAKATVVNGFITEFAGYASRVITNSEPKSDAIRAWDNPEGGSLLSPPSETAAPGLNPEPPDRFCGCSANPPAPVAATPIEGATPNGGDKTATYVGAFQDATADSNWMRGAWVDWSAE